MKKTNVILCLLIGALVSGCGKQSAPPPTATTQEATAAGTQTPTEEPDAATQPEATTLPQTEVPSYTETDPTVPPTLPEETTAATFPLPAPPVTAPTEGITLCGHDYQPGAYQAPTCQQAGFQNLICCKCGDTQQQLSPPLGHHFTNATCTSAQSCLSCGITTGSALGHRFSDGSCIRCGMKDPSVRSITVQVKDSNNVPLDGVTVALYIGESLSEHAGSEVSSGGTVRFTLQNHSGSYKLVLTQIPVGYKAQRESYTYRSDSSTVVLDILPVILPDDHSKAAYRVGVRMGDFTVTDIDGKSYRLSQLLTEKKLVMLNFWFCSCVPCKAEFPHFNSIYQRYGDELEILALNHFDSEAPIRQLRSQMGLVFPLATEQLGMQQGFGIQSYPVSVFIDSDGRIRHIQKDVGFETEDQLEALIRQLLGK